MAKLRKRGFRTTRISAPVRIPAPDQQPTAMWACKDKDGTTAIVRGPCHYSPTEGVSGSWVPEGSAEDNIISVENWLTRRVCAEVPAGERRKLVSCDMLSGVFELEESIEDKYQRLRALCVKVVEGRGQGVRAATKALREALPAL